MLDVLHYFLEEDLLSTTKEESVSKSENRERIYKQFYDMEYKYAHKKMEEIDSEIQPKQYSTSPTQIDGYDMDTTAEELSSLRAFNPKDNPAKPFVPATDFDGTSAQPFGNLLDAPLK